MADQLQTLRDTGVLVLNEVDLGMKRTDYRDAAKELAHDLGGRIALIADVRIPGIEEGSATIVNLHLENKCKPACRARQMNAILGQIKTVDHPVILASDLNTSGADTTPISLRRLIMERVKDYEFWATQALKWVSPVSLPLIALTPVKYFKLASSARVSLQLVRTSHATRGTEAQASR